MNINGLPENSVLYIESKQLKKAINLLPEDLIREIFRQLNRADICHTRYVCRFWREVSINQEISALKSLLTENRALIALSTVQPMLPGWQEQILNILKDLDGRVLEDLRLQAESRQALNPIIFDLAEIYKKVGVVNLMSDEWRKSYELKYISNKLVENGNLDKALEVANLIPSDCEKSHTLRAIALKLTKNGNLDKALEVANSIPCAWDKSCALLEILLKLMENGNLDKTLEAANSMSIKWVKYYALRTIALKLMENGNLGKALEVANSIPDEFEKSYALEGIANKLTENANLDKALEAANGLVG